ncbi:MAG: sulfatase [Pseudomonadota bacterium]
MNIWLSRAKSFVQLGSVALILGFILSIICATIDILLKRYLHYKLYYLLLLSVQKNLNNCIINVVLFFIITWVLFLISQRVFFILTKNGERARCGAVFAVCFVLLGLTYVLIPMYMTGELLRFYLVADLVIVLLLICLGYFIIKEKYNNILNSNLMNHAPRTALIIMLFVVSFNVGTFAYNKFKQPPLGPNIIIVAVDALRPDHLSAYGYSRPTSPTVAKLANEGAIFYNAYANSSWTKPSVATIFTSLYPTQHGLETDEAILPYSMLTAAEVFKNNGYRTYYINAGNLFIDQIANFDQGFEDYVFLDIPDVGVSVRADEAMENLLQAVSKHKDDRFFAYVHLMDAHVQYNRNKFNTLFTKYFVKGLEPGNIKSQAIRELILKNMINEELVNYLVNIYDGQIRFVDESIKEMLEGLRRSGVLDNTVIIFTADHGEEFWDHDNFGHGHSMYGEVIKVPFIIWGPGVKPLKIQTPVRLVDALPTALGLAKISTQVDDFEGVDIFKFIKEKEKPAQLPVFAYGTHYGDEKKALIKDNHKLIVNTVITEGNAALEGPHSQVLEELYDLEKDERERNNLINKKPDLASYLNRELNAYLKPTKSFNIQKFKSVTDERIEKLKALGYVQ